MPVLHAGEDEDSLAWVEWAKSLLDRSNWANRHKDLTRFNRQLLEVAMPGPDVFREEVLPPDVSGWYLFQAETWLTSAGESDVVATSRILPLLARIGRSIEIIRQLPGAPEKMRVALAKGSRQLIPTLFELAVALSYIERGWDVRFVPETPERPTPDLVVSKLGRKLWLECKHKSVPDFIKRERDRWVTLYSPIQRHVWETRPDVVFDIQFHVPLQEVPDDYLVGALLPQSPWRRTGRLLQDEIATVDVRRPDYASGALLLRRNFSRWDGSPLKFHFFGYEDLWKGITCSFDAVTHPDLGRYVDRMKWCAAAIWSCDAEKSTMLKANHFRRELADAVHQLPEGEPAGIHIGVDSLSEETVEIVRAWRNHYQALGDFDWSRRDVRVVYANVIKMEIPLVEAWAVTETAHSWSCGPSGHPYLHDGKCLIPPGESDPRPDSSLSPLLR